jgi:hypothetical protein
VDKLYPNPVANQRPARPPSQRNYAAEVVRETKKAICCYLDGDHTDHWIARSQIQRGSDVEHVGDIGSLIVSEWFANTAKLPGSKRAGDTGGLMLVRDWLAQHHKSGR